MRFPNLIKVGFKRCLKVSFFLRSVYCATLALASFFISSLNMSIPYVSGNQAVLSREVNAAQI
jgi:hypothetical protein